MKKIIVACDSFKGCLTSSEANRAVASAVSDRCPDASVVCLPVSDGGDGMLEAFASALRADKVSVCVHDPMMRRVTSCYGIAPDGTAVIEIAQAVGLTLVSPADRSPMVATSYGVGELIADAVRRGCRDFIVGLGGSATSDAGIGMLRALTDLLTRGGTIDDALQGRLKGCRFTLACDVRNPLCGPDGAAYVFAPQKGATPEMLPQLDARARRFADFSARHFGYDRSAESGAGAAGGLGYAFMQYLGATFRSGADYLLNLLGYEKLLSGAALVITGEGSSDRQTLMGKLPQRIMDRALAAKVPTVLLSGRVSDLKSLIKAGFADVVCINPEDCDLEEAMHKEVAMKRIAEAAEAVIARITTDKTDNSKSDK